MKVKVLDWFADAHTGVMNKPDTVIEVTEERLKEIQAVGNLVEVVKEKTTASKTKKKAEK